MRNFWSVVGLLLRFARKRSRARGRHQKRLLRNRQDGREGIDFGALALLFGICFGCLMHGLAAVLVAQARDSAFHVEAARRDQLVIKESTIQALREEAWRGDHFPGLPVVMTLLFVGVWFLMLAFQGEGLELDFQRRRHPMWEWLLSHPVNPIAVFTAEMLAPLAANPLVLSAPLFWVVIFWEAYGPEAAWVGGIAGGAVAVAACCCSKTLEIAALIRLSPRTRGAVLGLLSWLGYASLLAVPILARDETWTIALAGVVDRGLGWLPTWDGLDAAWVFLRGLPPWGHAVVIFGIALTMGAGAVWGSAWAIRRGLSGNYGGAPSAPAALSSAQSRRWLKDPLHRKELLWFWRDRGAVVQVILIPLTLAAFQAFNLNGLVQAAGRSWYAVAGMAVLFGTYFLFILGPRSLTSEGPALWIPLTWPRGLESLLKAKARLWWAISTVIVGIALGGAVYLFPADGWRIALVGLGWFLFSGSLAEKAVTLVVPPSNSGEPEPLPAGRRWAASLGTFTFAAGIISQQWALAFSGVVYSWLTSAAMWQNFRARLPYLFDPWSEKLPAPPTVMHAMVAISALMEIMAIPLALVLGIWGNEQFVLIRSIGYGVVGFAALVYMDSWLSERGVKTVDVWFWPGPKRNPVIWGASSAGLGLVLGLAGWGYMAGMQRCPGVGEAFHEAMQYLLDYPDQRVWLLGIGLLLAPVTEEYFFRGLLYRALDREWGGWKAVVASSCFFAIYHPPTSWLPVFFVGCVNAVLFKRSGALWPCLVVHAVYNAIVILVPTVV